MALKATIFKAELTVSDLDRHHYASHSLTLARHPSETDERLMVRLLAFALNADDDLAFARGQAEADEPELWRRGLDGGIGLWIELGLPDPKRLRKASARADEVLLYLYHGRQASLWWEQRGDELSALPKLRVVEIGAASVKGLAAMADKSLELSCLVQDGQAWLDDGRTRLELELRALQERSDR